MSTADLRGSLREALQFEPEFRNYKQTKSLPAPYLDRISVTDHRGDISPNEKRGEARAKNKLRTVSYKKLMIQPVSMPDLSHCKLQTNFQKEEVPYMAPDGSLLKGLRVSLQRGYIKAVKSANEETKQRQQTRQMEKYDHDGYERQMALENDSRSESPEASLFDRSKFIDELEKKKEKKQKAKEYNVPPNFECMLDFVYGPSNIQGIYKRAHRAFATLRATRGAFRRGVRRVSRAPHSH